MQVAEALKRDGCTNAFILAPLQVLQGLVMDMLRVLAAPDLEVRNTTLDIVMRYTYPLLPLFHGGGPSEAYI